MIKRIINFFNFTFINGITQTQIRTSMCAWQPHNTDGSLKWSQCDKTTLDMNAPESSEMPIIKKETQNAEADVGWSQVKVSCACENTSPHAFVSWHTFNKPIWRAYNSPQIFFCSSSLYISPFDFNCHFVGSRKIGRK